MSRTVIDNFHGANLFLSNFYPSPVKFDGVTYPTVEHAFQAAKTEDAGERAFVLASPTPAIAKFRGQKVSKTKDWDGQKVSVMESLLREKFADQALRNKLIAFNGYWLVEGNNWGDRFWGCTKNRLTARWEGQNHLGRLLMTIRDHILNEGVEGGGPLSWVAYPEPQPWSDA